MNILVQIRFCLIYLGASYSFWFGVFFGGSTLVFLLLESRLFGIFCDIRLFDFSLLAGLCFSVGASCDFVASKMFRSFDFLPPGDPF